MLIKNLMLLSFLLGNSPIMFGKEAEKEKEKEKEKKTEKVAEVKAEGNKCVGAGPQTPRDIDKLEGKNGTSFLVAPPSKDMNLCNVHFHRFAENKSAKYSTFVKDGENSGWACKQPKASKGEKDEHHNESGCSNVQEGDTIEVHWVYTSCDLKARGIQKGVGLGACTTDTCANPQLRVEAEVFLLTKNGEINFNGTNPVSKGESVTFTGSTTGPKWNNQHCSPLEVTWNVRTSCKELDVDSLDAWCKNNEFGENHAHGVRELVTDEKLLSKAIKSK